MAALVSFVERRSPDRLRATPLRRRAEARAWVGGRDRRTRRIAGFDLASTLELNLDRYPTKPEMLAFLWRLIQAAEDSGMSVRDPGYVHALTNAMEIIVAAGSVTEGVATLHGYQAFTKIHAAT